MAAISVTFLPQFLGAFPYARSPLGALAQSLLRAMFASRTRPRRRARWPLQSASRTLAKHFSLLRLARRHPDTFFECPPELLAYGPAHGGYGDPHAPSLFPQLAVAL